jgi:hypothetical protein
MNKAQLLIIGMALGFGKDHEVFADIEWDADTAADLATVGTIEKKDIFSAAPNGKSIFSFKQTWSNFDKLIEIAAKNGETITCQDLSKSLSDSKSAIDMAVEANALAIVFTPSFWVGHMSEMENIWYSIATFKRKDVDFNKIREEVAALEGRKTRIAQLEEMGIEIGDVRSELSRGSFKDIKEKLAAHGDHLRLEDLKIPYDDGDHALISKTAWDSFDTIAAELMQHGEVPDADFFLFKRGERDSFLKKAFTHNAQDKIFNRTLFKGRPGELTKLFDSLSDVDKDKVDIETVLSEVMEDSFTLDLSEETVMSVKDLLSPLSSEIKIPEGWAPIIPLGLKDLWDNIDVVIQKLEENGQFLSLDDLKTPSGLGAEPVLFKAIRMGHADQVMAMIATSGTVIDEAVLLGLKDSQGNTLLSVLEEAEKIELLLKPEMWAGRTQDFISVVWDNISAATQAKNRTAFEDTLTKANTMMLRAHGLKLQVQ